MAWTKMKTAAFAVIAIILAGGVTTAVVSKMVTANTISAEDARIWRIDTGNLDRLEPMVIVRPTRFPDSGGMAMGANRRSIGKNADIYGVLVGAYNWSGVRTIYPPNLPKERYDYISTMPDPEKALQREVEKALRLTAHSETRETDVLLMKVKNQRVSGVSHTSGKGEGYGLNGIGMTWSNEPLSSVAAIMEGYLGLPVLDRTGDNTKFDMTLRCNFDSKDSIQKALLDQLGLEFVPARERVQMLVVEKMN